MFLNNSQKREKPYFSNKVPKLSPISSELKFKNEVLKYDVNVNLCQEL